MHFQIYQNKIQQLIAQRNNALFLIVGLFVLLVVQSMTIYYLVGNQKTRFVPLPPVISGPFTVSRHHISASYIQDAATYLALLRLNYTAQSLPWQAQILLKYVDPSFYGILKAEIVKEITEAKTHDITVSFAWKGTAINPQNPLEAYVKGDLIRYVGETKLFTQPVIYRIQFRYQNGLLTFTTFTQVKKAWG